MDKAFEIRFTAPVGIMILAVFLFSPFEFLSDIQKWSSIDWVVSLIGVLGIGFTLSSVVNLFATWRLTYLKPEKELLIWQNLGKERKLNSEDVSNQVHKRWSMAMANFNAFLGLTIGSVLAPSFGWIPEWGILFYLLLGVMLSLFIVNGKNALESVEKINDILNEKYKKNEQ